MPDKEFIDSLLKLESGGVMAYTSLMSKLEDCSNETERKAIAIGRLPSALLCALQDENCLQDIKAVAEKYPEILPVILTCAMNLRKDTKLQSWTTYESEEYKNYISSLEKRISK